MGKAPGYYWTKDENGADEIVKIGPIDMLQSGPFFVWRHGHADPVALTDVAAAHLEGPIERESDESEEG